MTLLPEVRRKGYVVQEVRVVNRAGKKVAGFPANAFSRVTGGRFVSLPRSELAGSICGQLDNRVEMIFGDSIAGIEQTGSSVRVTFEHGPEREFDLVVGADGLHSRVRELVFGPQIRFEKYLGFKVAAFQVGGYRPRDELTYVMYTEVRQQVARFAMRGDWTMFLFAFADAQADAQVDGTDTNTIRGSEGAIA
jgi:2-polyprenyl-6-methoxyphenol hydroxylase-like FAD-dependent oxidoreductase